MSHGSERFWLQHNVAQGWSQLVRSHMYLQNKSGVFEQNLTKSRQHCNISVRWGKGNELKPPQTHTRTHSHTEWFTKSRCNIWTIWRPDCHGARLNVWEYGDSDACWCCCYRSDSRVDQAPLFVEGSACRRCLTKTSSEPNFQPGHWMNIQTLALCWGALAFSCCVHGLRTGTASKSWGML